MLLSNYKYMIIIPQTIHKNGTDIINYRDSEEEQLS